MYLWRRNRPRAVYDRVAIIHGVAYNVADEIVFKRHQCEWILPSALAKHIKYDPRKLPVVISLDTQPQEERCKQSSDHSASGQALLSSLQVWCSG